MSWKVTENHRWDIQYVSEQFHSVAICLQTGHSIHGTCLTRMDKENLNEHDVNVCFSLCICRSGWGWFWFWDYSSSIDSTTEEDLGTVPRWQSNTQGKGRSHLKLPNRSTITEKVAQIFPKWLYAHTHNRCCQCDCWWYKLMS